MGWVMLAGGLGAVARLLVDARLGGRGMPLGILTVNLLGSLLLGVVLGLGEAGALGDFVVRLAGVGFCGGFTTFSTAAVDAVQLAARRRWWVGLGYWAGGLAACVLAGVAGGWLAEFVIAVFDRCSY